MTLTYQLHPNNPNPSSGVFLKASLLHSAQPMKNSLTPSVSGKPSVSVPLGSPPDNNQGYGLLFLQNVLPIRNSKTLPDFQLFPYDLVTIQQNTQISYNILVTSTAVPLRATLVWYDPPAQAGTTGDPPPLSIPSYCMYPPV